LLRDLDAEARGLAGGVVVVDVDVTDVAFGAGGDVDADVPERVPGVREEGAAGGGDGDRVGVRRWVDFGGLVHDVGLFDSDLVLDRLDHHEVDLPVAVCGATHELGGDRGRGCVDAEQPLDDVGGGGLLDPLGGDGDAGDGGAEEGLHGEFD